MSPVTITLSLLVFSIVMFVWEKIPLAVTAMIVCITLVVTGVFDVKTAFVQAHRSFSLLTLASYYSRYRNGSSAAPSFSMAKYRFVPSLQ